MLTLYTSTPNGLRTLTPNEVVNLRSIDIPVLWADLLNPTEAEESMLESAFGVEIPTREEMSEIEISSRLYQENDTYYLTALLVTKADTESPQNDAATFVLTKNTLITLRYSTPRSFEMFVNRCEKNQANYHNATEVMLGLLDAITDRLADILEMVGHRMDNTSRQVFAHNPAALNAKNRTHLNLKAILNAIGRDGDLISKSRECLVSLSRLTGYITNSPMFTSRKESIELLNSVQKDLASLSDHANFLSGKINFLLDATLGMISIEQNGIIKIFSVAAVVFLPPTLVASIYGMNFHHMPELDWRFGYPIALLLMLLSAFIPFQYFKKKGWL
jgi:magnesium transporter